MLWLTPAMPRESREFLGEGIELASHPNTDLIAGSIHKFWGGDAAPPCHGNKSAMPKGNPRFAQIVGRHLDIYFVADADADKVLAHFAGDMGQHLVTVGEGHTKHGTWQNLGDFAI